ncbi:Hypothetical predicted protein, partial [Olea europaea subsp. europaea]
LYPNCGGANCEGSPSLNCGGDDGITGIPCLGRKPPRRSIIRGLIIVPELATVVERKKWGTMKTKIALFQELDHLGPETALALVASTGESSGDGKPSKISEIIFSLRRDTMSSVRRYARYHCELSGVSSIVQYVREKIEKWVPVRRWSPTTIAMVPN